MDRERRPDAGQQRPGLRAAEDPQRPDPDLLHPADVPLHVREQADGGHRPGRRPLGAVHAGPVTQGGLLPVLLFAGVLFL